MDLVPGIGYMNHNQTQANVKLQWSPHGQVAQNDGFFNKTPREMESVYTSSLGMDYVATRNIAFEEELFLDYGNKWEEGWQHHVQ